MQPDPKLLPPGAPPPAPVPSAYYQDPGYYDEPASGGLLEYWLIIRRRKGALVLIAFLATLAAILLTLPQTPIYQGRASIEIQELNENFLNMKQVSPVSEAGNYTALTDIQTQIKILQSDSLLKRVVAKLKAGRPAATLPDPGRISAWRRALNLPEPAPEDLQDRTLRRAKDNLKVRAAGQTRIIEILFDSPDPRLAAAFANTLASEYIDQNMEARWQMTQRTGDWLQRQLEDMRIKLERSEDALQRYARRAGLLYTTSGANEKTNINEDKLRQLQADLGRAHADRVARQSAFEMARTAPPDTLADVLNDASLREYQTKLAELRRQWAENATTFTPEHAKMRRVQAQIQSLELALNQQRAAILARIRNDYEESARREKLLADSYARQSQIVTQEAERGIQYNILKREVDSNRQLYEAMLQRVKEAGIASALRASNIRIVDSAEPPKFPYKPNLLLNAAIGLLAGLFLGVAFIVIRERADRTLQEPGDAAFYLNLPELGVIPSAASEFRKRFYYYGRRKPAPPRLTGLQLTGPQPSGNGSSLPERVELVTWQRKPSGMAESFRSVLTSILFSGKNGDRPRVIVLTSAGPAEGKTTVLCNLGIALAEIRQRVLLIDADLRKPRLHELLELDNQRGLSTLLEQPELTDAALDGIVHQTRIPGLFLLPAGPATPAATNLLYSRALAELIQRFKTDFDMLLIDTPPMLHMPDARVIGRLAGAVIIVARAGATTRDSAQAASQRLTADAIPVLGVILNDWNPSHAHPYSHYKNYYGGPGGQYYHHTS
jgi:succinoglycan biosynthesis transport protein ExoP